MEEVFTTWRRLNGALSPTVKGGAGTGCKGLVEQRWEESLGGVYFRISEKITYVFRRETS